jgi:hypothetical protein
MEALLALVAVVGMAGSAQALPVMHLDVGGMGANGTVAPGNVVTVSFLASEIPAGDGLFGFGFNVDFDATGLSAGIPQFGPDFLFTGFDCVSAGLGSVGATSNRFFQASGPVGDAILLATIEFSGLLPGVFDLSLAHLTGPGDNILFDFTVLDGSLEFFQGGSITVASVPEPGTASLLGLGIALFSMRRGRKKLAFRSSLPASRG